MTDIRQIRETLKHNPGVTEIPSTNNCGRINSMLQTDLRRDLGVSSELVTGHILGRVQTWTEPTAHNWLEVPANQIDGISSGPLIIDGSVDQFTISNCKSTQTIESALFETQSSAPDLLTAKPGDELYGQYIKISSAKEVAAKM